MELCRDIPVTESLFCDKTFPDQELAYEHMKSHGFRYSYPDNLKDTEGLMTYFGEKVGVSHCCIYCSRQFNSIKAVRGHVARKRHCVYDCDEEIDEFYDNNQIVPFDCVEDETGEIKFPIGRIYGHRKHQKYEKQNVADPEVFKKTARIPIADPTTPRESVTIQNDLILRKHEYFMQKFISKRERRLVFIEEKHKEHVV